MPNKTIYVPDADLRIFKKDQSFAGGNASAAIAKAVRMFIAREEGDLSNMSRPHCLWPAW